MLLSNRHRVSMLLAILAFSSVAIDAFADHNLTVSLETEQSIDGVALIDIDKPFRVVFTNNTDKEIRIWHPLSRDGYYCLTFRSTNEETRKTFLTTKRRIKDDAYFKALASHIESGSRIIAIQPHDSFTTQIELGSFAWGKLNWLEVPGPNTGARYSIQAQYRSVRKDDKGPAVWTGTIASIPKKVQVVSERIKTPHDYLWNNFPDTALRVMKDEPEWIKRRDDNQRTPLHVAARFRHVTVVEWLLKNGADVNAIAYNGFTPLHLASDPQVVKKILEYDPDLSIACRIYGQTPLQNAVAKLSQSRSGETKKNWRSIADLYLAAGAEYDILTAIEFNDLDRVKAVLAATPELEKDGFYRNSPLRRAASLGRVAICRYLIEEHKDDVDQFDQGTGYPIIKDALAHPDVIKLLIDNGADLKRRITWQGARTGMWIVGDDATALHFAATDGVPETVRLLLDAGVDLFASTKGTPLEISSEQTALDVAAYFGRADNANAIIGHKRFKEADAARRKVLLNRCLVLGAASNWLSGNAQRPKLLKILLAAGADPNATNAKGHTSVQVAASAIRPDAENGNNGPKEVVKLLRDHGATLDVFTSVAIGDEGELAKILKRNPKSVDKRGPDGYSGLYFAVEMGHEKIVEILLQAGADVNIRNKSEHTGTRNDTPLHNAAFWGRDKIAAILIKAGADVNARAEKGATPLHCAARMTNVRLARLLLDNGAMIDAKDKAGKTPQDWGRELTGTKNPEIEKLFREFRSK